jgi:hypothetical protein
VIYAAANDRQPLYVGQQVDVFLNANGNSHTSPPASLARSGVER